MSVHSIPNRMININPFSTAEPDALKEAFYYVTNESLWHLTIFSLVYHGGSLAHARTVNSQNINCALNRMQAPRACIKESFVCEGLNREYLYLMEVNAVNNTYVN